MRYNVVPISRNLKLEPSGRFSQTRSHIVHHTKQTLTKEQCSIGKLRAQTGGHMLRILYYIYMYLCTKSGKINAKGGWAYTTSWAYSTLILCLSMLDFSLVLHARV